MARVVDNSKLDRIRESATEAVVQKGYGGATINFIAKQAGVSEGYLYRFYKGKEELVSDLLFSRVSHIINQIEQYISQCSSVNEIVKLLVNDFFEMAETNPANIKFLFVLMNDYSFTVSKEQYLKIHSLCSNIIKLGVESNEISEKINEADVYLLCVALPIQVINLRIKRFLISDILQHDDKSKIVSMIIKSLKV